MGRAKGTPKTGGRKAGTPNKNTADLKTWVASILDNGRPDFERRLAKLEDKEYIKTFVGLLGYVMPKMSPINQDEMLEKEKKKIYEILMEMPEDVIDKITKRLYELQTYCE